jgi:hypothetical protein
VIIMRASALSRFRALRPQRKSFRPKSLKPVLEVLEDRTVPVTNLNVVAGVVGSGTQDKGLLADGQILFGDADNGGNTLSTGALAQASISFADLLVQADISIRFSSIGTLNLLNTGITTFSTATSSGGEISFDTAGDTLVTNSRTEFFAQSDVTLATVIANKNSIGVGANNIITLNGNLSSPISVGLQAGGGVTQAAGGIKAAGLLLLGGNAFSLDSASNSVGQIAGNVSGPINYTQRAGSALTVGIVAVPVLGTATGIISNDHDVTLSADDINIGQPIIVGTATLTLQPTTPAVKIDLGSVSAGSLSLTDQDFDLINAGTLVIGNSAFTGDTVLTGAINPAGTIGLVDLRTGNHFLSTGGSFAAPGDLTISAGNNVGLVAGTALSAGLLSINFGQDTTPAGSATAFFGGSFASAGPVQVESAAGGTRQNILQVDLNTYATTSSLAFKGQGAADIFMCFGTPVTETFNFGVLGTATDVTGAITASLFTVESAQLLGGAGGDVFNVGGVANSLDNLNTGLILRGEGGTDTLNLNDQGDASANTYLLTLSTFDRSGMVQLAYDSVETFSLTGGTQGDTLNIRSVQAGIAYNLNTGLGNDAISLSSDAPANLGDLAGINSVINLDAGAGANTLTVSDFATGGGNANVTITGNQILGMAGAADGTPVGYTATGGTFTSVTVSGSNAAGVSEKFTLQNPGSPVILNMNDGADTAIVQSTINAATVNGGAGNDLVTLISFSVPLDITGGTGTNTLQGPNLANTWNITGSNAGDIGGGTFSAMQNLTGGSNTDSFVFSDGAGVTGTIDGGLDTDQLDNTAYTTAVIVNLQTSTATGTGGFAGIEVFHGGTVNDTLIGQNADSNFTFNAANTVNYNGTHTAVSFENYTGGTGNDLFVFNDTVTVSGRIEGAAGTDTLHFGAWAAAVSFMLTGVGATDGFNGTAPMVGGGFTNINSLHGSSTAIGDSLSGLNANADWTLGTAADSFVSSNRALALAGLENFVGGTANDTFNASLGGGGVPSGTFNLDGGTGTDSFIGTGTVGQDILDVSGTGLTGSATIGLTAVEKLTLNTLGGDDVINLTPTTGVNFTLDGGDPTTAPGDTLNVDVTGLTEPVVEVNGFNQTALSFGGGGFSNLSFSNFENVGATGTYYVRMNVYSAGFGTLNQDGVGDIIVAQLDGTGTKMELRVNGTLAYSTNVASVRALTVRGSVDPDILIVQELNGQHISDGFAGAPIALGSHIAGSHIHFDGNGPGGAVNADLQSMFGGGAPDRVIIFNTSDRSSAFFVDRTPAFGQAWLSGSITTTGNGSGGTSLLVSFESLGTSTGPAPTMTAALRAAIRRVNAVVNPPPPAKAKAKLQPPRQANQTAARRAAETAQRTAQARQQPTASPQAVSDALFALPGEETR